MIKFREKLPKYSSVGILAWAHTATDLNSSLVLFICCKALNIRQSKLLVKIINVLTFTVIFLELYLVNSLAARCFCIALERFLFLFLFSSILMYLGRKSLPYWSGSDEEEEDEES